MTNILYKTRPPNTKNSNKIQDTCNAPPIPELTNRTSHQGGFLQRKLQKNGKNLLHLPLNQKRNLPKQNFPNWRTHPIIEILKNHTHSPFHTPRTKRTTYKNGSRQLLTQPKLKHTSPKNYLYIHSRMYQESHSQMQTTIRKEPKKINKRVFKNQETLHHIWKQQYTYKPCKNSQWIPQTTINQQPTHITNMLLPTITLTKMHLQSQTIPWHDLDGFIIE